MHLSDPARLGHPTTFPVQFGFAATGNYKSACRKLIRWGFAQIVLGCPEAGANRKLIQ
jgi:hypothetical protein